MIHSCFKSTGTEHGDHLNVRRPGDASCAALFSAALAPWETTEPTVFAQDALLQVAAELSVLGMAMFPEGGGDAVTDAVAHRVLAGIEGRARVAAEVLSRLVETAKEGGATR